MRKIIMLLASSALVATSGLSLAQEDEEAPEMYTYATYFECSGPFSAMDDAVAEDSERLNGLVEDGSIARWGLLGHHTGGQWSRVFYHQAESLDALLDGSDAISGAGDDGDDADEAVEDETVEDEADAEADDDGPGCTRHDDYIWQVENGSSAESRGAAGFSVYHYCDSSREERADEIVAEHVAPIMDGLVEDGSITSWGWSSHVVGGMFRRLQTMTATDHKALLAGRAAAIEAIYADDNEMGAELNDICGSHVDYMWDILHEN